MNEEGIKLNFNTKGMIDSHRMKMILKKLVDNCAINKSNDNLGFDIKNHNEFTFKNNQKLNIDFYYNGEFSIILRINENIDGHDFEFMVKLMENMISLYLKTMSSDSFKFLLKGMFMGLTINIGHALLLAKKDIGNTTSIILMIIVSIFNFKLMSSMISMLNERRKNTKDFMDSSFNELRRFVDIAERDIISKLNEKEDELRKRQKDIENDNKQ